MKKIMETKDSYFNLMKTKFDDLNYRWSVELNKLEAKAQHAKVEVKEKYEEKLKTLKERRKKMSQKVDQIDNASEEAYKDFKEAAKNIEVVHLTMKSILDERKKHKEQQDVIQNEASVAGLMLTTKATVAEKPEKKPAPAIPHGGMDPGMY